MSDWVVYAALIVAFLAVVAALVFLARRILGAWRALRSLRRGLGQELHRLADLGEVTVEKSAAASDTSRLDPAVARLRVTLARAAVLRAAIDEVEATVGRFTAVYPRK